MARIGLSDYIDCKSTNGGDGHVVSCVGCETGHEVEEENSVSSYQSLGHYRDLSNQADSGSEVGTRIRTYLGSIQMHPQLSDKKLGHSIRL